MAAKSQKQTVSTVVATSPLATAFLNIAYNRAVDIHEIQGLGKVGLKELSVGLRDQWAKIKEDSLIWLLQQTICDPDTGEFVLKTIEVDRLKEMPTVVFEKLVDLVFEQNGFKGNGSEELKNLPADQN